MIVLHPNQQQYDNLNGYTHNCSKLIFVKDILDRWIVGTHVLEDPNFVEIKDELNELERVTYVAPPDDFTTPPTMSGLKVEIPSYWEVFFPDDKFILNEFIVELERINGALAVDIAYLQWANFQEELDKPVNEAVKRHMMPIWDYVIEQINQNNFIP